MALMYVINVNMLFMQLMAVMNTQQIEHTLRPYLSLLLELLLESPVFKNGSLYLNIFY